MSQLRQLFETAMSHPELSVVVTLVFLLLGLGQYALGPDDDWVESYREKYWFKLHEFLTMFGGYAVVTKGPKEYVCSVKVGEEELEEILYKGKYHRNVIAAKKQRFLPGFDEETGERRKESSLNSWVHRESIFADMQGHATNFPGHKDGEVDIYHHYETSWVTHPFKHYFNVKQIDGDPEGTLKEALENADVEFYYDKEWAEQFN